MKSFCHPVVDTPDARYVCSRKAWGTTAGPDEYVCIWRGEHLALIRGVGHNTCRHIDLHPLPNSNGGCGDYIETVHRPGEGPRLTRKRVEQMISEAKRRDRMWPEELAAKREKAEAARAKREARQKLDDECRQSINEVLHAAKVGDQAALLAAAARLRVIEDRLNWESGDREVEATARRDAFKENT